MVDVAEVALAAPMSRTDRICATLVHAFPGVSINDVAEFIEEGMMPTLRRLRDLEERGYIRSERISYFPTHRWSPER